MKLQRNEQIVKVYHHHLMPLVFHLAQIVLASVPFYLLAFFFQGVLGPGQIFGVYSAITLLFALAAGYHTLFYLLNRIVVTNCRILHVDWKGLLRRNEHEAFLDDIQDITTKENGVFSLLPIFDFGTFTLETAATNTTVIFKNAPDPEGMKHFIYHLNVKPNRIGAVPTAALHDQTNANQREEKISVSR